VRRLLRGLCIDCLLEQATDCECIPLGRVALPYSLSIPVGLPPGCLSDEPDIPTRFYWEQAGKIAIPRTKFANALSPRISQPSTRGKNDRHFGFNVLTRIFSRHPLLTNELRINLISPLPADISPLLDKNTRTHKRPFPLGCTMHKPRPKTYTSSFFLPSVVCPC
jgi:hypothetical protein